MKIIQFGVCGKFVNPMKFSFFLLGAKLPNTSRMFDANDFSSFIPCTECGSKNSFIDINTEIHYKTEVQPNVGGKLRIFSLGQKLAIFF